MKNKLDKTLMMKPLPARSFFFAALAFFVSGLCPAWSQSLTNASLTGKYGVRYLLLGGTAAGQINDARSLSAVFTFDGSGGYTFDGRGASGESAAPADVSGSGTYNVSSTGLLTISNPLRAGANMTGRFAPGYVTAASPETPGTYDLLAGVESATAATAASLNGVWRAAGIEFPGGNAGRARATFFSMTVAAGTLAEIAVSGQAANLGRRPVTQPTQATYTIAADGSGRVEFALPGGAVALNRLVSGAKTIYLSRDNSVLLMGSTAAGGHDLLIAVKSASGTAAVWDGLFYDAGMRLNGGRFAGHAGSTNAVNSAKIAYQTRRARVPEGAGDSTGSQRYTLGPDGLGVANLEQLAVGASGNAFLLSGVSQADGDNYGLTFGFRAPAPPVTPATGPFLSPFGAANSASFSPYPAPLSPGSYVTLFGTRLASAATTAGGAPFPVTLGGVQVLIDNRPAPLYVVSPGQVICLVPRATPVGPAVPVVAVVNGVRSNEIRVPVAASAPAAFTQNQGGFGVAAITRPDFSLVTPQNPARRGDTIVLFLNGLGAVTSPPADGAVAGGNPLSRIAGGVNIYIGGERAAISFQGLTPGLVSVYQLNVVVPPGAPGGSVPLGIETAEGFTDHADVAIAP